MKPRRQLSASPEKLRARAEQRLRTTRRDVAQMPVEDVQKLVHELQVHQIELEMQNDALRRTQLELETARDRYAGLYDFAPSALLTLDAHGEILEANLSAGKLLGVERDRLVHQKFSRFIAAESQDTCYLLCREVFQSDAPQSAELELVNASAQRLFVQIAAVRDATSPRKQCRISFTDITARKQIEAERQKFVSLADNSSDFIGMCDRDFNPFYVNAAGLRLVGFDDLAAACRVKVPDFFFPEDQPFITREFFPRVQRDGHNEVEIRFRHFQTGAAIWMLYSVFNVHDASGAPVGWATVSRDITERKRAEAALRESEERLLTVAENLTEGLIISNLEGRLVHWNRAGLEMHGFASREECLRRLPEFAELFESSTLDGSPVPVDEWPLARAIRGESVRDYPLRVRRTDTGVERILSYGGTTVRDSTGRQAAFVTVTDITERKQAEAALLAREAQLHSFVQQAPAAIAMFDRNMNYLAASQRWMSDHGQGKRSLAGLNHYKINPDLPERWREIHQKGMAGETQSCDEDLWLKADGTKAWFRWSVSPWLDARGNIGGIMILAENISARKNAEEAVRLFQTLVNQSSDTLEVIDPETARFLDVNENGPAELGCTRAEYLAQRVIDIDPTMTKPNWLQFVKKIRVTGSQRGEGIHRRKDGTTFPIEFNAKWVRLDRDYIVTVVRDITERRRAEESLRKSEERLHSIMDNSPAMIFLKDLKGRYLHFNRKLAGVIHLSLEESVGKTDAELFPPNHAAMFRTNDRKMLAAGVPMDFEEETIQDDGSHICMVTKFPLRDAQGKIYAIGGIATDITERKRAEESLRRSEHHLTNFFNQAPIGLVWLSASGTILRANLAQLELLGYASADYLGQSFNKACVEPSQGYELLERLAAKETVRNFPMSRRCRDGRIRHVLVDANSFWSEGQFQYSAVFVRDITERRELEKEILQVGEREQRRIAQDLHDGLGQLLVGTAYLTSTLRDKLSAQALPEARELSRILEVVYEAIAQTRSLARGIHPVEPEPNGLMAALQALAGRTKKMFSVGCRFNCRRPVLLHDNTVATHLFRIAQEAITNAIKHGKSRRIQISLTATSGRITLAIKDNGTGLPARSRKQPGMGLRIMRYRAGMIGGSLAVQKMPAGGTAVICSAPQPGNGSVKLPAPASLKKIIGLCT